MPNTYFQFKQFKIDQGSTAMKVTTEGCILGAWVALKANSPKRILDIGAGTGLLSLMIAQEQEEAQIDAVELNEAAAMQAEANFSASPWAGRLRLHHTGVQAYDPAKKYDLIVSNPPFFNQSLASPKASINQARHDETLSQSDLVDAIGRHLAEEGRAFVLYPQREFDKFRELAHQRGLYLVRELSIFNSPGSKRFRVIGEYGREEAALKKAVLNIRDITREYTADFVALLKGYYLGL